MCPISTLSGFDIWSTLDILFYAPLQQNLTVVKSISWNGGVNPRSTTQLEPQTPGYKVLH